MKQDLQVAVLFSRKYLKEKNITVLIPEKVISGKCIQDSKFFVDIDNHKKIRNMDEANYQNQDYGYYYATSLKKLQKQYETTDIDIVLKKYMDDICSKVHYYTKFDEEDFESYLLKNDLIEDFNKKYNVKFKYKYNNEDLEKVETISSEYNKNVEDSYGKDIVNINKNLKDNILFQDRAINKIVKAIYNNYILGNDYNNILISGPSGVGKTKFLKTLVEACNHPAIYCSIKKEFADENVDANDVFNYLLLHLYDDASDNNKNDEHSIIVLDDFDKLDEMEKYEFQEELQNFFDTGSYIVNRNKKLLFNANKITFIICGNFSNIKSNINIPKNFFSNPKFEVDENDLSLDHNELIEKEVFFENLLLHFQTEVLFDNLDLEKAKDIINTFKNDVLKSYITQLSKQGVKQVIFEDGLVEVLANFIYSTKFNLKLYDEVIKSLFTDIMFDSLEYLEKSSELYINKEILQKNKKGYQFTLKK